MKKETATVKKTAAKASVAKKHKLLIEAKKPRILTAEGLKRRSLLQKKKS